LGAPDTMTPNLERPLQKRISPSRVLGLIGLATLAIAALIVVLGVVMDNRYEWRTIDQWLRVLALEPGRSGSPLDIVRVHVSTQLHAAEVFSASGESLGLARIPQRTIEVPLSYDLFRKHKALGRAGYIRLLIDGYPVHTELSRGTNGSCLIPLPEYIRLGPHQVAVEFVIRAPGHGSKIDLRARGSERAIVVDDNPTSH
jgi:hypothetical protein